MSAWTKFILTYLGGIFTGVVLMFLFAAIFSNQSPKTDGLVLFDKPQQEIEACHLTVFQVLPNGNALASVWDVENLGMVVLLLGQDGNSYFDQQRIDVPEKEKKMMQIGTYRYITSEQKEKTVPVVRVVDR